MGVDIRPDDLKNYRDLFAKLKHDAAQFKQDPSAYNLFNVMVTAWSLSDWLTEDLPDDEDVQRDLKALVGTKPQFKKNKPPKAEGEFHPSLRLCRDIAIASKHARIRGHTPEVSKLTRHDGGFGEGPFGVGPFGGEPFFVVETDEDLLTADQVVEDVIAEYEAFLVKHNMV